MHTIRQDGEVQYYFYLTKQAACENCSLARWARGRQGPQYSLHPWQYKLNVVLPDGERVEPRRGPETTTRRLNILLILLVVELAPIALLAFYFLAMFVLHPPFSGD